MNKALIFLVIGLLLVYNNAEGQNFYIEKIPKRDYYKVGFGVGKFFSSTRETFDKIENKLAPVVSLGFGRRYSNHFSLNFNASVQYYASNGLRISESTGIEIRNHLFEGMAYAFEVMPEFNLIPYYHHLDRPNIDFQVGIGLGIIQANINELFTLDNREFRLRIYKASLYIPLRMTFSITTGLLSNISLEGSFLYSFLDTKIKHPNFQIDGDHFGQFNLVYRKFLRNKKYGY